MASRLSYYNNTASFWDFVASMEEQASQHPFFGGREWAGESENEQHGWPGFPFGPMPCGGRHGPRHRHRHAPPPPGSGPRGPPPPPEHQHGSDEEAPAEHAGQERFPVGPMPHRGRHGPPHGHHHGRPRGPPPPSDFQDGSGEEGPTEMEHDAEEESLESREPGSPPATNGRRGRKGPGRHHAPGPRCHPDGRHAGFGRGFGGRGRGGPHGGRGGPLGGHDRHGFGFGSPMDFGHLAEMFQAQLFGGNDNNNKNDDHKPEVDVFDTTESFIVHVSLPGAKKEDVGVNWDAEKSELSIAGVIYRPADEDTLKTLALDERKVGAFERKVRLGSRAVPAQIDIEAISARLQDGILRIEVPKLDSDFVEVKKVDVE